MHDNKEMEATLKVGGSAPLSNDSINMLVKGPTTRLAIFYKIQAQTHQGLELSHSVEI